MRVRSLDHLVLTVADTPGSGDLCFLVDGDLEDVAEALARAGVAVELGPVERTGAIAPIVSVYVRDPDGNLVELSRARPAPSHP